MITENKKGQGLSTSTIVLLILGLIVLVILIWGFATGWNVFKPLVNPTNVDNIVQDCNLACSNQNKFSYCSGDRTLNVNEDNLKVTTSCAVLSHVADFSKYGIPDCPSITCDLQCTDIKINSKAGSATATQGYDVSSLTQGTCFVAR